METPPAAFLSCCATICAALELPALPEGQGTTTAALQQGWEAYRATRELEVAVERAGPGEARSWWQPVDDTALAQWQQGVAVYVYYAPWLEVEVHVCVRSYRTLDIHGMDTEY